MKKKRFSTLTVALVIILVLGALLTACSSSTPSSQPGIGQSRTSGGSGASGETIRIQWGSTGNDGMAANDTWKWAAQEIEKRTDGRIRIEVMNNSQLGNDESLLTQMMDGVLDMASLGTSAIGKYTPLFDGMQLPFLIDTYEKELAMIQSDEMTAIKEQFLNDYDLHVMALAENGLRHFATVNRAVNTAEDLKGLKMRVVPGTVTADAITAMGANATTIAYNEIYTSLQNKIIDSEEVNYSTISNQKHYEVIGCISEIGMYPFSSVCLMSDTLYQKLSEEDRKIIEQICAEAEEKCLKELIPQYEEKAREDCIANQVEINVVADKTSFISATEHLYKEYMDKDPLIEAFVKAAQNLN